jgi:acyl-CoA reductase-like NAD-dependent aldehyde dehydrogenase
LARLVAAMARESGQRIVGDSSAEGTVMGPLIEPSALERVLGFVEQARADGARIVTGGERLPPDTGGYVAGATSSTTSLLT